MTVAELLNSLAEVEDTSLPVEVVCDMTFLEGDDESFEVDSCSITPIRVILSR